MNQKRHLAASVLNKEGNFWMLGGTLGGSGTDSTDSADSTEFYEYGKKRWRKGPPLPSGLRDTGLQSHCALRLNSKQMFMSGGYATPYNVKDTVKNQS